MSKSYSQKGKEIIEKYYKQQDFQYTPLIILLEHYKEFTPKERTELFNDIIQDIVYIFKSMEKNEKLLMKKSEAYKDEYINMCSILNKLSTQGTAWYKEMEKTEKLLKGE